MPTAPKLIGSAEACDRLGIDRATLSRWVNHRTPKLTPVMRLGDRPNAAMLFDPADIDALLQDDVA